MGVYLYHSATSDQVAFSSALAAAPELSELGGSAHPEVFTAVATTALNRVYRSPEWVEYVSSGAAEEDAADLAAGVPIALSRSHPLAKVRGLQAAIDLATQAASFGVPVRWS